MKVILATGHPSLNEQIEAKFSDLIEVLAKPLFREAVEQTVARTNANVVIICDDLEGTIEMEELLLNLRARYPKTRIVYIGKKIDTDFKSFLYKYNIFDTLSNRFSEEQLKNAIFHPKTWTDISEEIKYLDDFKLDDDIDYSLPDISSMNKIDKVDYQKIKPAVTGKDSLYQEIISFWSVLDQAGKTYVATNIAIFLASNPDLKVILIDFSIKNPSVHLQFGFKDGDKNLGALIEDYEDGKKINASNLDEYLITHPVYPNLKILPGYILANPDKSDKEFIDYFNELILLCQSNNYSTILIDMASDVDNDLNVHILKSSTKIIMVTNESPGSLFAIKKTFDAELGKFVPLLIGKKKVFPVINKSTPVYKKRFKNALEATFLGNRTVTIFDREEDIYRSIFDGSPIMATPTIERYQMFFRLADLIHPGLFKPVKPKEPKQEEKRGLFGVIKKKK